MNSIGLTSDISPPGPAQLLFREFLAKSIVSAVINSRIVLGCLVAVGCLSSCGTSPAFDWQSYTQSMPLAQQGRGTNSQGFISNPKSPVIFGIGGWEGKNHMTRVIGPLTSRVAFSDSKVIAFEQWPDIMESIKRQHLDGHPIIIIAYSAGCSDALSISNILEKSNIPVGLILMDATYLGSGMFKPSVEGIENVTTIPGNVYMVENHVTHSPFGGRDLTTQNFQNPERTKFRNNYIRCSHLNLLFEKYSDQYAASVRSIMNEYSRRN